MPFPKVLPLLCAGMLCAPTETFAQEPDAAACAAQAPSKLRPLWTKICAAPEKSRTLALMYGGLEAWRFAETDTAEQVFDRVLQDIETVYVDNPEAEKARSLWNAESAKSFKGEPFERMMAYYYRGLLYVAKGDWGNAQAAFQGAVLQDTMARDKRFQADVASMVWLQGWSEHCRGGDSRAEQLFAEAAALNSALKAPSKDDRTLVLVETGQGPRKFQAGRYGEILGVTEGMAGNYGLSAKLGDAALPLHKAEDLYFQAATRGGRPVDDILAQKADVKDAAHNVALGALVVGANLALYGSQTQSNDGGEAAMLGLAVMLVGMLVETAAREMNPASDTRTWATLPHSLYLAATPADPNAPLELFDPAGRPVLAAPQDVLRSKTDSCAMIWVGAHSVAPSLAAPAGPQSAAGEAGNCRTSTGELAMLAPPVCTRIGGTPLTN